MPPLKSLNRYYHQEMCFAEADDETEDGEGSGSSPEDDIEESESGL